MVSGLTVVALIVGVVGLLFTSRATAGPTIVGLACLIGILARIAQAHRQHLQAHWPWDSREQKQAEHEKRLEAERFAYYRAPIQADATIEEKARAAGISKR
jgi:hypothetical protein